MKITAKTTDLYRCVKLVALATPTRTTLPSLSSVLFWFMDGLLVMRGSDCRVFTEAHCAASGSENGAFGVRADLLEAFLAGCTAETVEIAVDQQAVMTCGDKGPARFVVTDMTQFPKPLAVEGTPSIVPAVALSEGIRKISHAISEESQFKEILCGVSFEFSDALDMAAFSGAAQLAVYTTATKGTGKYVVPRRIMEVVAKAVDNCVESLEVVFSENAVAFRCADQWSISGPLLNGQFPDWKRLNTEGMDKIIVKRADIMGALRGVIPFGSEAGFTRVEFEGKDGAITCFSGGENSLIERFSGEFKDFDFAVEGKRFMNLLNVLDGDTCVIEYKDEPGRAVVVREETFLGAIMPLEKRKKSC